MAWQGLGMTSQRIAIAWMGLPIALPGLDIARESYKCRTVTKNSYVGELGVTRFGRVQENLSDFGRYWEW